MRLIAAAAALLTLMLGAPAFAESNVGVTAAVNQDAKGTVGSSVKTISLGDSVVFNQRIQTGGSGLVQVLLADGTTFMVGPNSDLVIDKFVYDPNAGTAQVTASFTKGVLRFIGGQTSKTENGVTINTPVGTMGIRGAMVDVVLDPPSGTPPHVDMLFGNEVTLQQGQDLLGRLYAAGYSLALGDDGKFDVLKTPPGWGSQIQAALAGAAGTKGGAPKGPSDGDVKNSEVANNNSGKGPDKPGLSKEELDALLYAAAHYDELRNFILNNQSPQGYVGGIAVDGNDNAAWGVTDYNTEYDIDGLVSYEPTFAKFGFDADGNPVAIQASFLAYGACDCGEPPDIQVVYTGNGVDGEGKIVVTYPDESPIELDTVEDYLYAYNDPRSDNPMNAPVLQDSDEGDGHDEYILADRLDCLSCSDFIKWGFWGFKAQADGDNGAAVGDLEGSIDYMGTWVTGDLTTKAQMQNLAALDEGDYSAEYHGDAVGVVHQGANDGYVATGDLYVQYNFGSRDGVVNVGAFDTDHMGGGEGIDFSYDIEGSRDGSNGFYGYGYDESWSGVAQGAFVNDGTNTAAGVIGNFNYQDLGGTSISGVFMGDRPTN